MCKPNALHVAHTAYGSYALHVAHMLLQAICAIHVRIDKVKSYALHVAHMAYGQAICAIHVMHTAYGQAVICTTCNAYGLWTSHMRYMKRIRLMVMSYALHVTHTA